MVNITTSKNRQKPPLIVNITPECGKLPSEHHPVEFPFNSKVAGLGNVAPILYAGLIELGADIRVIAPNLKTKFMKDHEMSKEEWNQYRQRESTGDLMLVNSDHIKGLDHIYDENCEGGLARTAAYFQKYVRNILSALSHEHEVIAPITNDWMAGGLIGSYLRTREIPFLHMMHSIHTFDIPRAEYIDTDVLQFQDNIMWSPNEGKYDNLESHLCAIINAGKVGVVGHAFLREVISGVHDHKIAPHIRDGLVQRFEEGNAIALPNGLYDTYLPETQDEIFNLFEGAMQFGPNTDDLYEAKRTNKIAFQNATGLNINPDAKLFFWPSRFESHQKGADIIREPIEYMLAKYDDIQVAIIAERPQGGEDQERYVSLCRLSEETANSEGKRLLVRGFDSATSDFCYSAADAVFGAQSYEPFGYWIAQALAAGTYVIARPNGGANDMVNDGENGFFVREQNEESLIRAMENTYDHISKQGREETNASLSRMMGDVRRDYGYHAMARAYLNVLENIVGRSLT